MKKSVKNKIIISSSALVVLIGIGIAGYMYYLHLSKYPTGIDQPFKTTVPFVSLEFKADSALVVHSPNGTHIEIPANAFVDDNGEPVKGSAEFKFREFHTADAILLSGIPMQMSNDRNQFMQSSGMIELRAYQNGSELSLAKGKSKSGY